MATKSEVISVLERISKIYGDKFILNDEIIKAWSRAFEIVAVRYLDQALQAHMENSRFVPVLADIRLEALKLSGGRFSRPKNYKAHEGLDKAIRNQAERDGCTLIEDKDKHGNPISYYIPTEDTIKVRGKPVRKIDLILDIFGEDDWNKEVLKLINVESVKDVSFSELMLQKDWVAKYKEMRDNTARIALEIAEARL